VTFVGEQVLFGKIAVGTLHLWLMRVVVRTTFDFERRAPRPEGDRINV
jgi:hypothetical protein